MAHVVPKRKSRNFWSKAARPPSFSNRFVFSDSDARDDVVMMWRLVQPGEAVHVLDDR